MMSKTVASARGGRPPGGESPDHEPEAGDGSDPGHEEDNPVGHPGHERGQLRDRRRVGVEEALDLGARPDGTGQVRRRAGRHAATRVEDEGEVEAGLGRLLRQQGQTQGQQAGPADAADEEPDESPEPRIGERARQRMGHRAMLPLARHGFEVVQAPG
jgi:hypothetical protein